MEWDVCDVCWGTGDESRKGVDLRKQRDEFNAAIVLEAAKLLSTAVGAYLTVTRPAITALAEEVEKLSRGRKERPDYFYDLARSLANTLRRMGEEPR